jgi:hypothetical protein
VQAARQFARRIAEIGDQVLVDASTGRNARNSSQIEFIVVFASIKYR